MNDFQILPAIDLRGGRVVRLQQGDPALETAYDDQPGATARRWQLAGAAWLHVVNLDGAFGEDTRANMNALRAILVTANGHTSVEFGGGIRDLASIADLLRIGVERIVIGTSAVHDPLLLRNALQTFGPRRVVLGVDARQGWVQISGWAESVSLTPMELISRYLADGLETVIYTNVARDGMQTGVDLSGTLELQEALGISVIASGGVGTLDDIRAVKSAGLAGVIVGKALYENKFSLEDALLC